MSWEYRALVTSLKKVLKAKKVTYSDLATTLQLSEQTLKRFFTCEDAHVGKVGQICDAIGISFFDLCNLANEEKLESFFLSHEQEIFLCENPFALAVFSKLKAGETSESIVSQYDIPETKMRRCLKNLEKGGFLTRDEGLKVKMLYKGTHNYIHGGPLHQKYGVDEVVRFTEKLAKNVLEHKGRAEEEFITFSSRRVSKDTLKSLIKEMRDAAHNFRKAAQRDENFVAQDDLISIQWVFEIAPWPRMIDIILENHKGYSV
ncbi:MAG: helix-turn-helix domain-containing protein [Oligoflexales bacterium]